MFWAILAVNLRFEIVKIHNESVVKFILNNKYMYVKPSIVLFLFELAHYQECVFQVATGYTCYEWKI